MPPATVQRQFLSKALPKGIYQLEIKKPDGNVSVMKVIY